MNKEKKLFFIGISTGLLILFTALQELMLNSMSVESAFRISTLWGLIKFILAVIVWRLLSNWFASSGYWANERTRAYKPALPPLLVILIIVLSAIVGFVLNRVFLQNQSYTDLNLFYKDLMLCGIFIYVTIFVISRNLLISLVKLLSRRGSELPRRIATGFSDGVLIFLHALGLILYRLHYTHGESTSVISGDYIRLLFMGVVLGGLRIAWGFVPEDRLEIVREFIEFLRERKLWWMTPIFVVLGLLIILVLLTQSTGNFPFIYAIF